MIVRIAERHIDPAQAPARAGHLATGITSALRDEPGALFPCAVALRHRPHGLRIVKGHADVAAHLETPRFLADNVATAGMVSALRLIGTDPFCPRGRALSHD
jgi:hypothetical protein